MGWTITVVGVIAAVALEIALVLALSRRSSEWIQAIPARRIGLLAACSLLIPCVFLLGAYVELRWDLSRHLLDVNTQHIAALEPHVLQGDPGLLKWARETPPRNPRPKSADAEGFLAWRNELRTSLLDVFDLSDIAAPVEVSSRILETDELEGNIKRTLLAFKSFDGSELPAFLFVPPGGGPKPAVVVLHGHVPSYDIGISQTGGLEDSYQHGAALELAKAGFVTITFEFRGFGYLGARNNTEHRIIAYNAMVGGSFYKAIVTRDTKYAFELLRSLHEVKPDSIGVAGVSLGGEIAVTYGALDERVKAVVSQGHGGDLGPYPTFEGDNQELQPHGCHIIPGHNKYLWREDMFALVAPRALLVVRGNREYHADPQAFSEAVGKGYQALGAADQFQIQVKPGDHEFFLQPAIEFFRSHL